MRFDRLAWIVVLALAGCSELRPEQGRINNARVAAENAVLIASHVPKSVVFRNETVKLRPDGPVVCGEFDGLTRKGEDAGFARFVFVEGDVTFEDEPGFQALWREDCTGD
jgi:hypothetical protein